VRAHPVALVEPGHDLVRRVILCTLLKLDERLLT
jgi:hypothetical protein